MCFVLYFFYTVRQCICTVWLNVNIDQMKNVTSSSSSFFLLLICTYCLSPSSSAVKVFSRAFPRPHFVEELECCAIINLANVVPSHVWPQKAIYYLWS